jgi:hypothetical protein
MSEQEMLNRIIELEEENTKLKNGHFVANVSGNILNQRELDFIYPRKYGDKWERCSVNDFNKLRDTCMSVVDDVNNNDEFIKQKVKTLDKSKLVLVCDCCDEVITVLSKYKKKYLESVGRNDIPVAYGIK